LAGAGDLTGQAFWSSLQKTGEMGDALDNRGVDRESPEQRLSRIEAERDYYRRVAELTGKRSLTMSMSCQK